MAVCVCETSLIQYHWSLCSVSQFLLAVAASSQPIWFLKAWDEFSREYSRPAQLKFFTFTDKTGAIKYEHILRNKWGMTKGFDFTSQNHSGSESEIMFLIVVRAWDAFTHGKWLCIFLYWIILYYNKQQIMSEEESLKKKKVISDRWKNDNKKLGRTMTGNDLQLT